MNDAEEREAAQTMKWLKLASGKSQPMSRAFKLFLSKAADAMRKGVKASEFMSRDL
jgi:hypothetical protein